MIAWRDRHLFAGLGAMVAFAAQMSMGVSWRVGVVGGETGDLVSGGLYRFSRNPTFVGQFAAAGGGRTGGPCCPTILAPLLFLWSAITQSGRKRLPCAAASVQTMTAMPSRCRAGSAFR